MRENVYCIKDTNGRFEGHINICSNSMVKPNSDWKWDYASQTYPMSGNLIKKNALLKVQKLRELNALAEYDLDWEVVEFTEQEYRDMVREYYHNDNKVKENISIETKEIKVGCICKYRKMVKDIYRKYKHKYIENRIGY